MAPGAKTLEIMVESVAGFEIHDAIAGGPARSRELDKERMEYLESVLGGTQGVRQFANSVGAGLNILESDWVVTRYGLYYVAFNAQQVMMWAWSGISEIRLSKRARLGPLSTITVALQNGRTFDLQVGRHGVDALLDAALEFIP